MRAFSMMELLVALAIVAVLAAIVLPTLGVMRSRGEASRCVSNLRQIGVAVLAQARDRNGLLPDMGAYSSDKARDLEYSLLPYLGYPLGAGDDQQDTVFTCPSAWKATPTRTRLRRTYGINRYATSSRINEPQDFDKIKDHIPLRLQNVKSPSSMALFMDGAPRADATEAATYYVDQNYARLNPTRTPTCFVHSGALHVVFLDGHVEPITEAYALRELAERQSTKHPFWGSSN